MSSLAYSVPHRYSDPLALVPPSAGAGLVQTNPRTLAFKFGTDSGDSLGGLRALSWGTRKLVVGL